MTGWRSRAVLVSCLIGLVLPGTTAAAAAAPVPASGEVGHRTVFRFADRAILESSGLVDAGSVVYTMNDSGAGPLLYAVDPDGGETTGVTTYSRDEVVDVEALAPGPGGTVWVGDIGDNLARRPSVTVYRVRPGGAAAAPGIELTYPGGPRDAEALLAHPQTGRLYVVSKTVFGGVVYEAGNIDPGAPRRMRRFAQVPGLVTDGAFFPDGRHVLLRGYGTASVYTFPGFALRGTVTLPAQRQGEGVAIGPDGRILLSSEGLHAPVLEVELPADLAAEVAELPAAPSPPPSSPPGEAAGTTPPAPEPSREPFPAGEDAAATSSGTSGPDPGWILGGAALLAVLAALTWATRRRT